MAEINEKEHYHELTDKQKRVVQELADDPTAQNTEIADRAGVSRSTVYNVKEEYGHIVNQQINQRGRDDGEERTEGDPFRGQLEIQPASQVIGDRPHQPDTNGEDDAEINVEPTESERNGDGVTVEFDRAAVQDIIKGGDSERVRAAVVEALVEKAFAERAA